MSLNSKIKGFYDTVNSLPYKIFSTILQSGSAFQALERVRKAIGWRQLPEGTEVWEVEDKRLIGAGPLSPRMVKVLSKLEANRVLLWKPHANQGGRVYNYDVLRDHTDGRALSRVSQDEGVALEGKRFIEGYKTVMQGGYSEPFMGRSRFVIGEVTKAWLLSSEGREALKRHDRKAKVKRRYHGFDGRFSGWGYGEDLDDDGS